jgi:formamidopyrimidine-DNA glycosylase
MFGHGTPPALHLSAMPELPEVETIRRALEPQLRGEHLVDIEVLDARIVQGDADLLRGEVLGRPLVDVGRRGKHLLLLLTEGKGIALHLRMTGALLLSEPAHSSRVRAILRFSNGAQVFFNDMRRLGTITFVEDVEAYCRRLGPEPLSDEFTAESLARRLAGRRIPIKAALLDQHLVAGVGNMYADEALFLAGIHPLTPASSLSHCQTVSLWQALREVLCRAIADQGASISTYALPGGEKGTAHERFNVAHRKGQPCPKCGAPLQRLMVRKRGAYFCPACQPLAD